MKQAASVDVSSGGGGFLAFTPGEGTGFVGVPSKR